MPPEAQGFDYHMAMDIMAVLLATIPLVLVFLLQRSLTSKDEARLKWHTDMETRMSYAEDKAHKLELDIHDKISRDELEKTSATMFQEMKEIKQSINTRMDNFQQILIDALTKK
jgi:hypothetical protein